MFKIITDSTADLPESFIAENNIDVLNLSYILEGKTYGHGEELDYKEFYRLVREGHMPTTSQVNPEEALAGFEEAAKENDEILYLAFSSGLSGTYNSGRIACDEMAETAPNKKIIVVDTLCASLGEGLIVYYATKMRNAGKSIEEVAKWCEDFKLNMIHVFTVDDLMHLYRGGRVSKTSAIVGSVVGIKPMLHVDDEGHLTVIGKVRGRKKSLQTLVELMDEKLGNYKGKIDTAFISHGDCEEDALFVRDLVKEKYGIENFIINPIAPTVGTHAGPGTVALFFMGDVR